MTLTTSQYIEMLARMRRNQEAPSPAPTTEAEADIQDAIEGYLKSLGTSCFYIRHRMDRATTCAVGCPDFIGWLGSKPFALEVKKPGQKPTTAQLGMLLWAQLAGAKAEVVHSLSEATEVLAKL